MLTSEDPHAHSNTNTHSPATHTSGRDDPYTQSQHSEGLNIKTSLGYTPKSHLLSSPALKNKKTTEPQK